MNKKLMGFLAFAPIVLIIVGFLALFGTAFLMMGMGIAMEGLTVDTSAAATAAIPMILVMIVFFASYGLVFIGVILAWVDIVWFIILACKNPEFETIHKVLWALGIYCLNIFICPVYWALYIRK